MSILSGFTLVRNAVKLDFPIVPAIRSLLEVCDEVVVNVGASEDDTRDLVASINDPRVRILDTTWDFTKKNLMLSIETQRAMDACRGSWGIYIQADEVLHERGAQVLRETVRACDGDARVEGLLVKYLHFYGGFDTIATNRRWYRREVRCIRLGKDIHPYQGAQGFRVGPEFRRIRARVTEAEMFHYGWARPAKAILQKLEISKTIYPWGGDRFPSAFPRYSWLGPYDSAVSKKVIPTSSALCTTTAVSAASNLIPKLLQPRPMVETESDPMGRDLMPCVDPPAPP